MMTVTRERSFVRKLQGERVSKTANGYSWRRVSPFRPDYRGLGGIWAACLDKSQFGLFFVCWETEGIANRHDFIALSALRRAYITVMHVIELGTNVVGGGNTSLTLWGTCTLVIPVPLVLLAPLMIAVPSLSSLCCQPLE